MAKMYTLDNKLLTDIPEIRIGEKVYPVDNRQKTVTKMMAAVQDTKDDVAGGVQTALKLAFGPEGAKEIDAMNMPYPAYQELFTLVLAAMTGDEPEAVTARFQEAAKA